MPAWLYKAWIFSMEEKIKMTKHGRATGGRHPTCHCGSAGIRDDKFDSYYCPVSGVWLEINHSFAFDCGICKDRPEKKEISTMTAKKTVKKAVAKKSKKVGVAHKPNPNKKKPLGRMILQGRVCGSRVGSVSQRRMMPTTGIPLHIEQVIAQCVDTKTARSLVRCEAEYQLWASYVSVKLNQLDCHTLFLEESYAREASSYWG